MTNLSARRPATIPPRLSWACMGEEDRGEREDGKEHDAEGTGFADGLHCRLLSGRCLIRSPGRAGVRETSRRCQPFHPEAVPRGTGWKLSREDGRRSCC